MFSHDANVLVILPLEAIFMKVWPQNVCVEYLALCMGCNLLDG